MRIKDALAQTAIPRNEAEVLLAHILKKKRSWLLAHNNDEVRDDDYVALQSSIERRLQFEPIAYITGNKEFYGREFIVTPDVLIPRPSTETLIDVVADFLEHQEKDEVPADTDIIVATKRFDTTTAALLVDVGTGSGCIGITLALEHPHTSVICTDNSTSALTVGLKNVVKHEVDNRIQLLTGDLLSPILDVSEPFLVVSNPPYIPKHEKLIADVEKYEPPSALLGGNDGSMLIKKIIDQAKNHPHCVGICMECRSEHAILFA